MEKILTPAQSSLRIASQSLNGQLGRAERVNELGLSPIAITDINVERALASLASLGDQPTAHDIALTVLSELYAFTDEAVDTNVGEFLERLFEQSPELWAVLVKAHPLVLLLADITAEATAIADLSVELLTHTGQSPRATPMLTTIGPTSCFQSLGFWVTFAH